MYEESMQMPLIVSWPGVTEPGSINADLVQNLDYTETFLEIAGAEIPETMQGRSLVPLLNGETPDDWRTSLYYHYFEYPGAQAATIEPLRQQRLSRSSRNLFDCRNIIATTRISTTRISM